MFCRRKMRKGSVNEVFEVHYRDVGDGLKIPTWPELGQLECIKYMQ